MILCSWLTLLPNQQWLSEEVSVYPTHHSSGSGRVCRVYRVCRVGLLVLGFAVTFGKAAHAQTWTSNRSTPTPGEIVAADGTGEDGWLFGAEDVADDGLDVHATRAEDRYPFCVREHHGQRFLLSALRLRLGFPRRQRQRFRISEQ